MKLFSRSGLLRWLTMIAIIAAMLLPTTVAFAGPGVTVDTFDDTQNVTRTGVGTEYGVVTGAGILGGERDLAVTVTTGGGALTSDANVSLASHFSHSQGSGVFGTTTITYDGTDGDATTLNPTGLQTGGVGVDLTSGGAYDALFVLLRSDDWQASLKVTVYTDAIHCSSRSLTLPGGIPSSGVPKAIVFRYGDFTTDATCASPASFSNVGAVVLLIDGTANEATDITFSSFEAGALDYGDLPGGYKTNYSATYTSSGPGHVATDLYLGSQIDTETGASVASLLANHDDNTGVDEDGIVRANTPWADGANGGAVNVNVTGGDGCLMGWIDWANDGGFDEEGDLVLDNVEVTTGTSLQQFTIPTGGACTDCSLYARFRLFPRDEGGHCTLTKTYMNQAYGGEVEDYLWNFGTTAVSLSSMHAGSAALPVAPIGLVVLGAAGGAVWWGKRRRG